MILDLPSLLHYSSTRFSSSSSIITTFHLNSIELESFIGLTENWTNTQRSTQSCISIESVNGNIHHDPPVSSIVLKHTLPLVIWPSYRSNPESRTGSQFEASRTPARLLLISRSKLVYRSKLISSIWWNIRVTTKSISSWLLYHEGVRGVSEYAYIIAGIADANIMFRPCRAHKSRPSRRGFAHDIEQCDRLRPRAYY